MTPVTDGPGWYDVLDVDRDATEDQIRDAWRDAVADLTPADRRFRLYSQAAEVLLDPERRAAYDAQLDAAASETHDVPPPPAAASEDTTAGPRRPRLAVPAMLTDRVRGSLPARTRRPAGKPVAGPHVPTWLLGVVAVLTVLSLALTGYLFAQPSEESVEEAAADARSAAERAVVPVLSYDHRTLEEDQAEAHEWLTDSQREEYDELFALIRENAPSTRTVVEVEVVTSAIVRAGEERTEVLLFVNRPTTNKANQDPIVYKDQVTLTMERVGDEWLVDDLKTSPVAP